MAKLALVCFSTMAVILAADSWEKVRTLKSGSEMRIFKKGSPQPVQAQMDELTEESLRVVVKNEQVAIPREDIDKIEARPPGGSRVTRESTVTRDEPAIEKVPPQGPKRTTNPAGGSASSSVSYGGKPGFELIYRRPAAAPR